MLSERFNKAFNALTEAYFNGTLKAGDCEYCAVGNICIEASRNTGIANDKWAVLFYTADGEQIIHSSTSSDGREAMRLIKETMYSVHELAAIEKAFETNTQYDAYYYDELTEQQILEDQYKGLCAVIDVLMSFEDVNEAVEYKEKMKHPKLIPA